MPCKQSQSRRDNRASGSDLTSNRGSAVIHMLVTRGGLPVHWCVCVCTMSVSVPVLYVCLCLFIFLCLCLCVCVCVCACACPHLALTSILLINRESCCHTLAYQSEDFCVHWACTHCHVWHNVSCVTIGRFSTNQNREYTSATPWLILCFSIFLKEDGLCCLKCFILSFLSAFALNTINCLCALRVCLFQMLIVISHYQTFLTVHLYPTGLGIQELSELRLCHDYVIFLSGTPNKFLLWTRHAMCCWFEYPNYIKTVTARCSFSYKISYRETGKNMTLIALRYTTTLHYITLHFISLQNLTLPYLTLPYLILHYITLHYTTLHYISFHYTTLPYLSLPYIALHYITSEP